MNLSRELKIRLDQVNADALVRLKSAEEKTARRGAEIGRALSSGTLGTADLRRMGHPYAARDPRLPGLPINVQSGVFRSSFLARPGQWQGGQLETGIANASPIAMLLQTGTKTMIARPVADAIIQQIKPIRRRNLTTALRGRP